MVLRAIGTRAGEPTVQHAQLMHAVDVELLPSMRRTTLTIAADLKAEQALDVTSDAVVVRLDDSRAPGFVDELDEMLFKDRAREIVIHGFATERVPSTCCLKWRPGKSRIASTAKRPDLSGLPAM